MKLYLFCFSHDISKGSKGSTLPLEWNPLHTNIPLLPQDIEGCGFASELIYSSKCAKSRFSNSKYYKGLPN